MRLPGTAERLRILRNEMEKFHSLSPDKLALRKKWAQAKLADIERTLVREKGEITEEDKSHFDMMRSVTRLLKTLVYLGVTAMAMDLLKKTAGGTMTDIGLVLGGCAGLAVTMSKIVERFFGGNFESVSDGIRKALVQCKDALGR